jgi:hypothetical protein
LNCSSSRVDIGLSSRREEIALGTDGVDLCKIAPYCEPETVLAIDELTSDFELKGLEKSVGKIGSNFICAAGDKLGWVVLDPEALEKISVTGDCDSYAATSSNGAVDGLLNRLNGEVGVATVDALEESDLGLACKVDVLSAVGNKLHKSSSHF